jgi:hypothetical protein
VVPFLRNEFLHLCQKRKVKFEQLFGYTTIGTYLGNQTFLKIGSEPEPSVLLHFE